LANLLVLSTALLFTNATNAHELRPIVADISVTPDQVQLTFHAALEPFVAGMNLAALEDTDQSPLAELHDRLRAMEPQAFEKSLARAWPAIRAGFQVRAGGADITLEILSADIPPVGDTDLPRESVLVVAADLPPDGTPVTLHWGRGMGLLALRQTGGDDAYEGLLSGGDSSAALPRTGTAHVALLPFFVNYVTLGVEHIVPKGLDHILFVLGLFFFSLRLRALFWQVSVFTIAHTLTLALASLGVLSIPASIVEPLIAASIAYVAIENILGGKLGVRRILVVFGFGLLHGLGFASVLGEIGLQPARFVIGLVGFNIGVEIGQIAIILTAFLLISLPFGRRPWYRTRIVVPVSVAIGLVGFYWTIERIFF